MRVSCLQTLKRLDVVMSALCPPDEYAAFANELQRFAEGPGPKLQEELLAYDKSKPASTFVTEFWNESYFTGRYVVVLS